MADDTGSEHSGTAEGAEHGKGGGFWKKHKVEVIAAAVGIVVTIYLYYRNKQNSANAATTPNTASAVPVGGTGTDSGSGGGGGWWPGSGGSGIANDPNSPLNQALTALATSEAATQSEVGALSTQVGALSTSPIVNITVPGGTSTTTGPSNVPGSAGTGLTPQAASAAVSAGAITPRAAIKSEQTGLTGTARHNQEVANRKLRSEITKPTTKATAKPTTKPTTKKK